MTIAEIFGDKELKSKQRTETLGGLLIGKEISVGELIKFARDAKDPVKATCIEAMEIATKKIRQWPPWKASPLWWNL